MYRIERVSVNFGERTPLRDVSLQFNAGELCMIVGPNGAGKTTLLRCLDGGLKPTQGEIFFNGKALHEWPTKQLAQLRAVLPQHSNLEFPFSVRDVALMGRMPHDDELTNFEVADAALQMCDCAHLAARAFPQLSGGEQRRVQAARVIAQILGDAPGLPQCLMLDEPLASLDLHHQYALLAQLKKLARTRQLGVICTLHDLNLAAQFAERCIILDNGMPVADGAPADVFTEETLSHVFDLDICILSHPQDASIPLLVPKI